VFFFFFFFFFYFHFLSTNLQHLTKGKNLLMHGNFAEKYSLKKRMQKRLFIYLNND